MEKIKVIRLTKSDKNFTLHKTYEVIKKNENNTVFIIDDAGETNVLLEYQYEKIK